MTSKALKPWSVTTTIVLCSTLCAIGCGGKNKTDPDDSDTDGDVAAPDADATTDTDDLDAQDVETDEGGDVVGDTPPVDADGDGFMSDVDCDDGNDEVYPGADEVCNGSDDNCDGTIDEDTAIDAGTWYADGDGDGYGDEDVTAIACNAPSGYVDNDEDCDDADNAINPGQTEICNGVDDDCDGAIDEDGAVGSTPYYEDSDSDGYGNDAVNRDACEQPSGYVTDNTDCDDTNSSVFPLSVEYCNGIDDDCDGAIDEDTAADAGTWYEDVDGDGFGDPTSTAVSCVAPTGFVANSDDCNDSDGMSYPGAADVPDAFDTDSNCDGIDGNASNSVFVSADMGLDSNSGLTPDEPVRSLALGMGIAAGCTSTCDVLVTEGTYTMESTLDIIEGVDLYGGYTDGHGGTPSWERTLSVSATVITSSGPIPTIGADAITVDTVVDRFTIVGADATLAGQSSVAIVVTNTPTADRLTFANCEIHAGDGEAGASGVNGSLVACSPALGGDGGSGGGDCGSNDSDDGQDAPGALGGDGGAGGGNGDNRCDVYCPTYGGDGHDGSNGDSGGVSTTAAAVCAAATTGAFDASGNWTGCTGGNGVNGGGGGGGGGGGEGGGVDYDGSCAGCSCSAGRGCTAGLSIDGANGGPGGNGGCGGGGGTGAQQGGGSFGIVLIDSRVTLDTTTIMRGAGGSGGTGGNGVAGSNGTAGTGGNDAGNCCLLSGTCINVEAGDGGDGGNGGTGGGGSGGAAGHGGPSIGVAVVNDSASVAGVDSVSLVFTGGSGGAAGTAGTGTGGASSGSAGAAGDLAEIQVY